MDFSTSQNLAAVLISDDFPLFRLGIRHAIHSAFGERQFVELDGNKDLADLEVGSGGSLLILNYSSRKPNDIAKYVELKKRNGDFKMLIIASDVSDTEIHDIFSAGVDGFLLKNCGLEEFQEAISKIETGERYFAPNVSSRLLNQISRKDKKDAPEKLITKREREILQLIFEENTNPEIAEMPFNCDGSIPISPFPDVDRSRISCP